MEAGAAAGPAAATGDGTGQQQQQQQQGGQPSENGAAQGQPQGQDAIAQMAEQLQGLTEGQEQTRQFLENAPWVQQAQQQEEEQPPPAADLSFLDETSPNYDPQQAAERLTQVMREQAGIEAQRLMAERMAPMQAEVSDMRTRSEADALAAEFPELAEPAVAKAALDTAAHLAEMVGQPELATNMQFLRLAYINGRAMEMIQQQQGAAGAPAAATLEGAAGASPGGAGQGGPQETAESIRQAWSGGSDVLSKL